MAETAARTEGWLGPDQDEVLDPTVRCDRCAACCCRKEVRLFEDAGVPGHWVVCDAGGAEVLDRLDDGWCVALDRQSFQCRIYGRRPALCRAVTMGGAECLGARADFG